MKTPVLRRLFAFCKTGVLAGVLCFFLSETRADTVTVDFSGTFTSVTVFGQFPSPYPLWATGDSFTGGIIFDSSSDLVISSFLGINTSVISAFDVSSLVMDPVASNAQLTFDPATDSLTYDYLGPDAALGTDAGFHISIPQPFVNPTLPPDTNIEISALIQTDSSQFSTGTINSVTFIIPDSGTTFTLLGIGIFCLLSIRRFIVC
jgi:hypothetical protein